eukprot:Skav220710  [mRNA]  locus=scaffold1850:23753:24823:+ [translate_table: standard]
MASLLSGETCLAGLGRGHHRPACHQAAVPKEDQVACVSFIKDLASFSRTSKASVVISSAMYSAAAIS